MQVIVIQGTGTSPLPRDSLLLRHHLEFESPAQAFMIRSCFQCFWVLWVLCNSTGASDVAKDSGKLGSSVMASSTKASGSFLNRGTYFSGDFWMNLAAMCKAVWWSETLATKLTFLCQSIKRLSIFIVARAPGRGRNTPKLPQPLQSLASRAISTKSSKAELEDSFPQSLDAIQAFHQVAM